MQGVDGSDDLPTAKGHCVKWSPITGIDSICADVGLMFKPPWRLVVRMYFSLVRGHPPKDLLLEFENVASFRHERELFYGSCLPDELPRFDGKQVAFPLLIVEDSPWAKRLADRHPQGEGCIHYAFISLGDTVEVLAPPPVRVDWVPATDE